MSLQEINYDDYYTIQFIKVLGEMIRDSQRDNKHGALCKTKTIPSDVVHQRVKEFLEGKGYTVIRREDAEYYVLEINWVNLN